VRSAVVSGGCPRRPPAGRRRGCAAGHTHDAPLGMPAHVTVLFPFGADRARLRTRPRGGGGARPAPAASTRPSDATFAQTARFPGVLNLAPRPGRAVSPR
jgi:hypothetical protein